MNFDFQAAMVVFLLVAGAIWIIDRLVWAPRRREALARAESEAGTQLQAEAVERITREPVIVEYARAFFPIILLVLVIRSFLAEPFRIPSNSMMPTLLTGDFILVNKFVYGIRVPLFNSKVIEMAEPKRGDVVVFRFPGDPSVDYIKRVVGLPGDRITYRGKDLYVNGERVEQREIGTYIGEGSGIGMTGASLRVEHLGAVDHEILIQPHSPSKSGETIVEEGHYFVMGDNRDNSNDSRFWGLVPEENLVGKAFLIWMNWDWSSGGVDWSRIGSSIH